MRVRVAAFALACLVMIPSDRFTPMAEVNQPGPLLDGAGRVLLIVLRTIIRHESLSNLFLMMVALILLLAIGRTSNNPE